MLKCFPCTCFCRLSCQHIPDLLLHLNLIKNRHKIINKPKVKVRIIITQHTKGSIYTLEERSSTFLSFHKSAVLEGGDFLRLYCRLDLGRRKSAPRAGCSSGVADKCVCAACLFLARWVGRNLINKSLYLDQT